jgi:hypothetical protein
MARRRRSTRRKASAPGKGSATIAAGQSGVVKIKPRRALLKPSRQGQVDITTVDPSGNTVQNAKVKVGGKKSKKHKKHSTWSTEGRPGAGNRLAL